jgi:hypothetical protein
VQPDPDTVTLNRYTLAYTDTRTQRTHLGFTAAFAEYNAKRFIKPLRYTTALFLIINLCLIEYDAQRFAVSHYDLFQVALGIRLGAMLPVCLAVIAATYSKRRFVRHSQWVALPLLILGACLIAYSITGYNPGYGTLALLIVYNYSFSPLSVWAASAVAATLLITYGIVLTQTASTWDTTNLSILGNFDGVSATNSTSSNPPEQVRCTTPRSAVGYGHRIGVRRFCATELESLVCNR